MSKPRAPARARARSFASTCPACVSADVQRPAAASNPAPGVARLPRRILIVEDNLDVAETAAIMLTLAGHTVRCAHDATQAQAQAQEFAPEVVLLDVGLPRVDGYQVAQRLRQLPQTRHALLVGLTGYGMPADRQRGREAGFDHHLLKPADPTALCALIEGWQPASVGAAPAGRWSPPEGASSHHPRQRTLYAFKRP